MVPGTIARNGHRDFFSGKFDWGGGSSAFDCISDIAFWMAGFFFDSRGTGIVMASVLVVVV
jgi:hypothetical protein